MNFLALKLLSVFPFLPKDLGVQHRQKSLLFWPQETRKTLSGFNPCFELFFRPFQLFQESFGPERSDDSCERPKRLQAQTSIDCLSTKPSPTPLQKCTYNWENPKGGLANGGLAQKAPIGPKKALSGEFLLPPRGCEVRRNRSRSAPKSPRWALKRLQSGPKRPDFPGRIFARFSLKIWGLSPRL